MSNAEDVSMMFRAQVDGRCQIQRIDPVKSKNEEWQDSENWADEWVEAASEHLPEFGESVQTQDAKISWRLITNSGQDEGVIRPVIGARGVPFYPGSSMKGAFRQACNQIFPDRVNKYCGEAESLSPGILRFHGSYPVSNDWTENLVDVVHPQIGWQVQNVDTSERDGGAFAQISLYQPELRFGISSTIELDDSEWSDIWRVWEAALLNGIGGRVAAGYGKPMQKPEAPICPRILTGQGVASLLIDRTPEFRPNIFRAALRGHALRIFGGLTDAATARAIVNELFGGIHGGAVWGLLTMEFRPSQPFKPKRYGSRKPYQYHYKMKGELTWGLTQSIGAQKLAVLKQLVLHLMRFAMLLGGFGKGWRRIDHRKFYDDDYEKLIGCHWTWNDAVFTGADPEGQLNQVGDLIDRVRAAAQDWMRLLGYDVDSGLVSPWREAWCNERVQVWGRVAESEGDSAIIQWLHQGYDEVLQGRNFVPTKKLKRTQVSGFLGNKYNPTRIGRLWHRMYPVTYTVSRDGRRFIKSTDQYLELLTFFPDPQDPDSQALTEYLNRPTNTLLEPLW